MDVDHAASLCLGEDEVFAKVTTYSASQRTKVTRSNTIHRSF
ncbi:hypothetical protein [Acrocarpospora catenulata]|nr:hypothetical protein [Acrocarpospora catenulata]